VATNRLINRLAGSGEGQPQGRNLDDIRRRMHQEVIDRIDVVAVAQLDREQTRARLRDIVERMVQQEGLNLSAVEREGIIVGVLDEITGLGPLEGILGDPAVSDILVNGPDVIYVERKGKLERVNARFRDNAHLINTISRIVGKRGPPRGRGLPHGGRPPARRQPRQRHHPRPWPWTARRSPSAGSATIPLTAEQLVGFAALTQEMLNYLKAAVRSKCNILISRRHRRRQDDAPQLRSRSFIPHSERIITLEDSAELKTAAAARACAWRAGRQHRGQAAPSPSAT
jgi:pilus assembly protein CpaF